MMLHNQFLSLIVPVYNEETRLRQPLPRVLEYLTGRFNRFELIYVDDGSTDNTYHELLDIQKTFPALQIVRSQKNLGKGNAVRSGFQAAKGEIMLFSDADFSTPVEETEKLLDSISRSYDIAIGSRGMPDSHIEVHQPWAREMMGKTFNLIIRTLLPIRFKDTQCGFKMFRRSALSLILPKMQLDGFAFDVEMLMLAQLGGLKIVEVPVIWRNVKESRVHPIRSSFAMFKDVIALRNRLK